MLITLRNAHLIDAAIDIAAGEIIITGAYIQAVVDKGKASDSLLEQIGSGIAIDATGMILMPGFIDVHTHGGGGFNLHTTDVAEIQSYARWVSCTGVTSFLIAVVGIPDTLPEQQLKAAVNAIEDQAGWIAGAEPLGIHLEGPYINAAKRGAHSTNWLRLPDEAETERLIDVAGGYLRLLTLAPELPGAAAMISRLIEAGITVSMGHTDSTYEQAQEAIRLGITHVTHCYNAMPPLLHHAPGPLAALSQAEGVLGELIADGVHVHPAAANALVKLLGPERIIVITDALAGAGLTGSTFEFAGQPVHAIDGAAYLADGTITGSLLTMDQALPKMLEMTTATPQQVVGMMTLNPARSAGVAHRKGRLQAGYDADVLIFDQSLALQATLSRGIVTYATNEWRKRLLHQGLAIL